ncbi:hypothetical protein, partial [uncultured Sphingomonas sp.]|uniref:hypothetical protein n=1 Tax=uncultured Sphingomonas sp. TaxID=158754 RepID=UPI00261D0934
KHPGYGSMGKAARRPRLLFERHEAVSASEGAAASMRKNGDLLWQLLRDEWEKGVRHSGRTLEDISPISQKATRNTLRRLLEDGRVVHEDSPRSGRGGAHSHLRPVDPL